MGHIIFKGQYNGPLIVYNHLLAHMHIEWQKLFKYLAIILKKVAPYKALELLNQGILGHGP